MSEARAEVHSHLAGQGCDVAAFLVGDGDLVVGQHGGQVLQGQVVFSYLDDVMQPLRLISGQPVREDDHQAVQPPGEVFEMLSPRRWPTRWPRTWRAGAGPRP